MTIFTGAAPDHARLLASLQERQSLLERLSGIQRSITTGRPLQEVLDAIVLGAADLLGEDVVGLRLLDPGDPGFMLLAGSTGIPEHLVTSTQSSDVHASPEGLLRDADVAMHRAKRGGKRRCALFQPAMRDRLQAHTELERELRRALLSDALTVHDQPVVDARTGTVVSTEALLRWEHPQRGLVRPAEFVPLAEDTGLIIEIGSRVLREACRQTATWRRSAALPDLTVSVTLSPRQLQEPRLLDGAHGRRAARVRAGAGDHREPAGARRPAGRAPARQPPSRSDAGQPARKDSRTERVGLSTLRSTSATDCQVPRASSPPSTGTVA